VLLWGGLTASLARAETFKLVDGSSLEGDIVSGSDKGAVIRLSDGKYADRTPWEKFTQEDLKKLSQNPKFTKYVQMFLDEDETEATKKPAKPPIVVKPVEVKLERPAQPALIGGFFGSPVGWLVLLLLYAANIWAAYEVAIFRAQPLGMVCGLAAVVPVIPQITYLCMPTRMPKQDATLLGGEAALPVDRVAPVEAMVGGSLKIAQQAQEAEAEAAPATPTVFKRGEVVFNRRFFETRFTDFFGMVRRDKSKGAMLLVKTSKTEHLASRITRITANEMHLEVLRGTQPEEVGVSFVEIQEVQLRSGGAR